MSFKVNSRAFICCESKCILATIIGRFENPVIFCWESVQKYHYYRAVSRNSIFILKHMCKFTIFALLVCWSGEYYKYVQSIRAKFVSCQTVSRNSVLRCSVGNTTDVTSLSSFSSSSSVGRPSLFFLRGLFHRQYIECVQGEITKLFL
jgi:hypothetical protein